MLEKINLVNISSLTAPRGTKLMALSRPVSFPNGFFYQILVLILS